MSPTEAEIVSLVPMARNLAEGYCSRFSGTRWNADVESQALWALWLSRESYDPSFGVPFPIYAMERVRGACRDGYRQQAGTRHAYGEVIRTDPVRDAASIEHLSEEDQDSQCFTDPFDLEGCVLDRIEIGELGRLLPTRLKEALFDYAVMGWSGQEVGRRLGCSGRAVLDRVRKAQEIVARTFVPETG